MLKILLYNKRGLLKGTVSRSKFPTKIEITDIETGNKVTYKFWKFLNGSFDKAGYKETSS